MISAFCRSHFSYKSDKFWTVSDGRKLRRISTIVDSMVQGLQGTIAFTPILMIRRNIIRQRKESMRLLASQLGFFVVIALYRNFILFKKVDRRDRRIKTKLLRRICWPITVVLNMDTYFRMSQLECICRFVL